ncbi:hypothetical protein JCM11641_005891 [Rhodosporidiobolus odoratus]
MDSLNWKKGLMKGEYQDRKQMALLMAPCLRDLAREGTVESEDKLDKIKLYLIAMIQPRTATGAVQAIMVRTGGILGLAAFAIGLEQRLPEFLDEILNPIFGSIREPDATLRYIACESVYNIGKIAGVHLFKHYNAIFAILSALCAETDPSVRTSSELLDRLMKDQVTEYTVGSASFSGFDAQSPPISHHEQYDSCIHSPSSSIHEFRSQDSPAQQPGDAFVLSEFVPVLTQHMSAVNPFTRTFIIGWIDTLASVPELELVSFLPQFLAPLLTYAADPTDQVNLQADGVLRKLLFDIKQVRELEEESLRRRRARWLRGLGYEARAATNGSEGGPQSPDGSDASRLLPRVSSRRAESLGIIGLSLDDVFCSSDDESYDDAPFEELQRKREHVVQIDYCAILDILLVYLKDEVGAGEALQITCLRWIAVLLQIVPGVIVNAASALVPAILVALSHQSDAIRKYAFGINQRLFGLIRDLSTLSADSLFSPAALSDSPAHQPSAFSHASEDTVSSPSAIPFPSASTGATPRPGHDRRKPGSDAAASLPHHASNSTLPSASSLSTLTASSGLQSSADMFDGEVEYPPELFDPYEPDEERFQHVATVDELVHLVIERTEEDTLVTALAWLTMLHEKSPTKTFNTGESTSTGTDDTADALPDHDGAGTDNSDPGDSAPALDVNVVFSVLSSDKSPSFLDHHMDLVAQICLTPTGGRSPEEHFKSLILALLDLFRTDEALLESKGSFIVGKLCNFVSAERLYRTCADILEHYPDEKLDFVSTMIQHLNHIMITGSNFGDFRKMLRTLDTKDGQSLFVALYRSWSHNAVATFTLCLLAQAYEQASNLLQIFADLEMTVSLLVQVDKLVQLIESPVFTSLRLQLLEPERHPFLLKAMYGLLMLLPQSSAFATLRNRLNAVSTLGFLGTVARTSYASPTAVRPGQSFASAAGGGPSALAARRNVNIEASSGVSTPDPPSIRWNELLNHFRSVQKHRAAIAASSNTSSNSLEMPRPVLSPRPSASTYVPGRFGSESDDPNNSLASGTNGIFSGSRFTGTKKRANPPFLNQYPPSRHGSFVGTARNGVDGSASTASSFIGTGRSGTAATGGRPGSGSGFVGTAPGGIAAQRALTPTLLSPKRRVGAAPQNFGSGFGGTAPRFG